MEKPKTTPKDFFLWAGAMLALYVSTFSFIALMFDYINWAFPDPIAQYYVDPYSSSMRFYMASLLVLFPLFLTLMRFIRKDIAAHAQKSELWVRRWALVLTIFVAGATVAIDLITLINSFLGGDLTEPFLFKVLIVLLVAGAGFLHFLADIRGYWEKERVKVQIVGAAAALTILCTIATGFLLMGAPWQQRLFHFDDQKVTDLQNIQWQVVSYWQQKSALPESLSDLSDPISGYTVPVDTQTNQVYEYNKMGEHAFELCAVFNADSRSGSSYMSQPVMPYQKGNIDDNWQHGAGRVCFERIIDPERYPPVKK